MAKNIDPLVAAGPIRDLINRTIGSNKMGPEDALEVLDEVASIVEELKDSIQSDIDKKDDK